MRTKNSNLAKYHEGFEIASVEGFDHAFTIAEGPYESEAGFIWAVLQCGDDSAVTATFDEKLDKWTTDSVWNCRDIKRG